MPIHPRDRRYFSLCWHSREGAPIVLTDNYLCFGVRTAPGIFNTISSSVVRMMERLGIECCSYLDDYLIWSSTKQQALSDLNMLIGVLRELGFYIYSMVKNTGPLSLSTVLGFQYRHK